MDFFDVIKKRGTYRGEFKNTEIPKEDLIEILDAGIRAPSGLNFQPVNFLVVTEPEQKSKVDKILNKETTKTAPAIILVLTSSEKTSNGLSFEIEDYGAAVENVLLAITAKGYASVWMDGVLKFENKAERIKDVLDIPADFTLRAVLPVGVPQGKVTQKEKKPFNERVFFNSFD